MMNTHHSSFHLVVLICKSLFALCEGGWEESLIVFWRIEWILVELDGILAEFDGISGGFGGTCQDLIES